jgi:hypothetical protein
MKAGANQHLADTGNLPSCINYLRQKPHVPEERDEKQYELVWEESDLRYIVDSLHSNFRTPLAHNDALN